MSESIRIRANEVRAKLAHKPGADELVTPEDRADAAPFYFELRSTMVILKAAREAAGLTLADVSSKTGVGVGNAIAARNRSRHQPDLADARYDRRCRRLPVVAHRFPVALTIPVVNRALFDRGPANAYCDRFGGPNRNQRGGYMISPCSTTKSIAK